MSLTFSDLSTDAGLKQLNDYMVGRSFVFGIAASKADLDLVALVKKCPDCAKYPAAARWWNYISGFNGDEKKAFKAYSLSVGTKSVEGSTKEAEQADDDSDDDLFGSDDEEEEGAIDLAAEAAKAAEASKANQKMKPILRSQIVFDIKPIDTEVDLEDLADEIKEIVVGDIDQYADRITAFDDFRVTKDNICTWGVGHEIQPIAFGIEKLCISCCVIDEMLGVDDVKDILEDKFGEKIQSVDVRAFNKAEAIKAPKKKKK